MPENQHSSDLPRIQRDIVRRNTLKQMNGNKVHVRLGELLTDWLPWKNLLAEI